LAKLKAELRAHVFLAIDEDDRRRRRADGSSSSSADAALDADAGLRSRGGPLAAERRDALLSSAEGLLLADLLREALAHLGCQFTLRVLEPELLGGGGGGDGDGSGGPSAAAMPSRPMLASHLGLDQGGAVSDDEPLLLGILRTFLAGGTSAGAARGPTPTGGKQQQGRRSVGGGSGTGSTSRGLGLSGGEDSGGYRPPTCPPSLSPGGTARQHYEPEQPEEADGPAPGLFGAAEEEEEGEQQQAAAADARPPTASASPLPCASVLTPVPAEDDDDAKDEAGDAVAVVTVTATAAAAAAAAPASAGSRSHSATPKGLAPSAAAERRGSLSSAAARRSSDRSGGGSAEDDADLAADLASSSSEEDGEDGDGLAPLPPPAATVDESPIAQAPLARQRAPLAGAVGAYELGASIQAWPTGKGVGAEEEEEEEEAAAGRQREEEEEGQQQGEEGRGKPVVAAADWLSAPLRGSFDVSTAVYGPIAGGQRVVAAAAAPAAAVSPEVVAAGVVVVGAQEEHEDEEEEEEEEEDSRHLEEDALSLEVGSSVGVGSPPGAARARDASPDAEEEEEEDEDDGKAAGSSAARQPPNSLLAVSDHSGGLSSAMAGVQSGHAAPNFAYFDYVEDGETSTQEEEEEEQEGGGGGDNQDDEDER
jgi:hypothetical protein